MSGMVLLGSTGEAVMLSDEESREALRVARNAAAPEKVLLAGVGRESVIETLRLADFAAELDTTRSWCAPLISIASRCATGRC
jgi:4-hydroxy-2-oxoglutarate aldolase